MTERKPEVERLVALMRDEAGDPAAWTAETADVDPRIALLLEGELASDEAQALAGRLIDDPELGLQTRVAAALMEARREEEMSTPVRTRESGGSRWPWAVGFAVAAAALVAVFVRPPTLDSTDDSGIRSGSFQALEPTKPSASLPRDGFALEWTGGPTSAVYDLFVTTAELVPVYQARELSQARKVVPAAALDGFKSGTKFLWRVVAVTRDGRRVHSTAFEVVLE